MAIHLSWLRADEHNKSIGSSVTFSDGFDVSDDSS